MVSRTDEFHSAYDERPDPKGPGQQGVLFRKVAPAQSDAVRYGKREGEGEYPTDRATRAGAVHGVPGALYHGTAAKLKPGSLIVPGKKGNYPDHSSGVVAAHGKTMDEAHEHVFATEELHYAYSAAKIAQGNRGTASARAHVYRVEPTGPVQADAEDEDYRTGYSEEPSLGAYQSKRPLRVLNEVQFSVAQEAHRSYNEDELGEAPGSYEFAKKPRQEEMW